MARCDLNEFHEESKMTCHHAQHGQLALIGLATAGVHSNKISPFRVLDLQALTGLTRLPGPECGPVSKLEGVNGRIDQFLTTH